MPKIQLDRTIQYKRKTYKLGETVEISVEDVENLLPYGTVIEEEQPKKSTKRSKKRVDE